MGTWGPKLYQDDISEDVKTLYLDLLKRGLSNEEVTNQLIDKFKFEINDLEDGPIFWFALADCQWNAGRLLTFVKDKAIYYIDSKIDLHRWTDNKKDYEIRLKILNELKEKLVSPLPNEKKIAPYKSYKCPWKIGDVFAYQLHSEYSKQHGL